MEKTGLVINLARQIMLKIDKNDKILVAVSGGEDSVVMLDMLAKANIQCVVAHCNFQLRGEDSNKDEIFVKNLAKKYGFKFFVVRFDTRKYAKKQKISIEMAARNLRYKWFEKIRTENNCKYIATAHHQNDSVETVLLNLTRGTGLRGLTGIPLKNRHIVRPILHLTKNQISEYVQKNNLQFRTDKTNFENKHNRNKIRNQIIPLFETINPAFAKNISENIERFSEIEQIFMQKIEQERKNCISIKNDFTEIDIEKLKNLSPLHTYLYEFLQPYNFSNKITDDIILSLNAESGKTFFSETHRLIKDRNKLIISNLIKKKSGSITLSNVFGNVSICKKLPDGTKILFEMFDKTKDFRIEKSPKIAYFDFEKLSFPLELRKWQAGDYFFPFGMKGKKKISDFFVDKKMSLLEKENAWLLSSNGKIIWVVGMRTDGRFAISLETKKVLKIEKRYP